VSATRSPWEVVTSETLRLDHFTQRRSPWPGSSLWTGMSASRQVSGIRAALPDALTAVDG
jgi:hypothetical protein